MKQVKSYKILQAETAEELQVKVNNMLQAEFTPIGGVQIRTVHEETMDRDIPRMVTSFVYAQSMIGFNA